MENKKYEIDVITIGRSSVDLYGQQIGAGLEDATSFSKFVGGCPANIAIGAARLGLRSALISRVGEDPMGRFIIEQMQREGVDVRGIARDAKRLTALALVGAPNDHDFPLLYYRNDCADMALSENDIDPEFIRSSRTVLVSGTHFSQPNTGAAQKKAMRITRENHGKVVFDVDFRPAVWGFTSLDNEEERCIRMAEVSATLRPVLSDCDLISGTEEEMLVVSGEKDLLRALQLIRSLSQAIIILKRGAMGCIIYEGEISDNLEAGVVGKGFSVDVYNTMGAGDSFISGFLRAWLGGERMATCATWANACGAFAVSRLLCASAIPTFVELQYFLQHGSRQKALRHDQQLNHIHWATTRGANIPVLMAIDMGYSRKILERLNKAGDDDAIVTFNRLAVAAAANVAESCAGCGVLLDGRFGRQAMFDAQGAGFAWMGRTIDLPESRPLRFDFSQDAGSQIMEWPNAHCIGCRCVYHPDDAVELKEQQQEKLLALLDAARKTGRELALAIIAGKGRTLDDLTVAQVLTELYALDIRPDWWMLEPQPTPAAWQHIHGVITKFDPWCRGIILLAMNASDADLGQAFEVAGAAPLVKGFVGAETVFLEAARLWFSGEVTDDVAIALMAERFERLTKIWLRDAAHAMQTPSALPTAFSNTANRARTDLTQASR